MVFLSQILFSLISFAALFLFSKNLLRIRKNILLGKEFIANDQPAKRWKNVFLLALGQQKMFQTPLVAILHLFV